ncbi:MAG TPA: ATP-binding cassette domain-containing protein, partial [Acidimicrobiia bacterium]|nr:ATP-binding cassette domain-containing protein [Acidimicrobiia bacterium]
PVLTGLDFEVGDGEVLAVLGPNGAGKTTLARALTGVVRPRAGTITYNGHRLEKRSPKAIVKAGIVGVPQGRRIFPGLTVLDNLRAGGHTRGRRRAADVEWALSLFPGLRDQAYRTAGALPAGEQQVLALARALVARPTLLVVDEVSAGVSPALAVQLFDVLRGLSLAGVSLLVIDQFVNLTLGLADRVIILENSRVCACSEPASLVLADVSWQSTHPGGDDPSANRSKGVPQ